MGYQIIKCPKRGYNVFSTISDSWLFSEPCNQQELINWYRHQAAKLAEKEVIKILCDIKAGRKPYLQFTMTFPEANAADKRARKE